MQKNNENNSNKKNNNKSNEPILRKSRSRQTDCQTDMND